MKDGLLDFMATLNANKKKLTEQQYRSLRGKASAGDVFGAKKGLHKLLKWGVKHAY